MIEHYPGSAPRIYGFEFVGALVTRLQETPMDEALAGDPEGYAASLVETLRQLPDDKDGWHDRGVHVTTELDAVQLWRNCATQIFDHVSRQSVDGFAETFLAILERSHDDEGQDTTTTEAVRALDLVAVAAILARTLNSSEASPQGQVAIGAWAARRLDDDGLALAMERVSIANLTRVSPNSPLRAIADGIQKERLERQVRDDAAAQRIRELEEARLAAVEAREVRRKAEDEAASSLAQGPENKTAFWAGYERLAQEFPPDPEFPLAELMRQSILFEKWRERHIEAKRQAAADWILAEQGRNPEVLAVPEGCENITFDQEPDGYAVFPDLEALLSAMQDYYAPRNEQGELLMVNFIGYADTKQGVVDELLVALRAWGESDESNKSDEDEHAIFRDPLLLGDGLRGSRGDLLAYQNTALEGVEVEVAKGPDGVFFLNQCDVGIYAGVPFRLLRRRNTS